MTTRKKDPRPTLTLKGDMFDAQFRLLLNKAAKRSGMTQAAFAAEVLRREAQRVIKGEAVPEAAAPPAILDDLRRTDERVSQLAAQVEALTKLQQRSLWERLIGIK